MLILIHAPDAEQWRAELARHLPEATLRTTAQDGEQPADYLVVWQPPQSLFKAQDKRLRAILNTGAGVDALLDNPALPRNVPLVRLRDAGMGDAMGDYLLYGLLHFHRGMDHYQHQQREQCWQEQPLEEKSRWPVGIVGLGTLGQVVARRIQALGYPVQGWSRSAKTFDDLTSYHGDEGLNQLLESSRVIFSLLPNTPQTRDLLDHERLGRLPRSAVVINAGRGSSLVLEDLQALLDTGHLRGALLDVFPEEPLPADHPLWQHPRVLITPHVAAPTPIAPAAQQIAEAIAALERGDTVETVDPERGY
ncbi:2-hydroxyacid dehydrogenase [Kushneria phosphatilytica]|uniref:Glyoxylate/hydroxypyruvate reductase A n=1 Tax=Kushneria phosphatilytica TaxID=657387 RepID=A0A1S1NY95_9GAMM|nr:glyoxylate/hydroxypyruvate reductase A [Kushneria phosphatilytica]OHV13845.1 glyoxylate/hydroxypyruvate reductase A [Kushneria phosphatilytica]QEL10398.1 glyoxylate/hydroxypyruvate reductase A [Kushneria phosphatilytica]